MRISAKSKYGLSSMIYIAQNSDACSCVTVLKISEELGVSKIYLEQVFALLKKAGLVISIKGANGGYQLARASDKISAYDILYAIEVNLFEETGNALSEKSDHINKTLEKMVWDRLDCSVKDCLQTVTLSDLAAKAEELRSADAPMYYI